MQVNFGAPTFGAWAGTLIHGKCDRKHQYRQSMHPEKDQVNGGGSASVFK